MVKAPRQRLTRSTMSTSGNNRKDSLQVSNSDKKSKPRNCFGNRKKPLIFWSVFFFTFCYLAWYWSQLNVKSSVGDTLVLLSDENTRKGNDSSEMKSTCRQTYFWGGGKSGSTTLFHILTVNRKHEETGAFYSYIVKEPCFRSNDWKSNWEPKTQATDICRKILPGSVTAPSTTAVRIAAATTTLKSNNNNNNDSDPGEETNDQLKEQVKERRPTHILNGCPRHTTVPQAKNLIKHARGQNATFIMLIRDPVDRLESHFNDNCRRAGRDCNNMETLTRSMIGGNFRNSLYLQLSFQGLALKNLLSVVKDPKKILIVPMESLTVDIQGVVDAVMDHVGGERWYVDKTKKVHLNKNNDGKYTQFHLSNSTTEGLRKMFAEDVRLLENIVGKKFAWSAWARNETDDENNEYGGWLATKPHGL